VGLSWYEAMAYCAWRGEETSLLTETQWERAARGDAGRRFPWGDEEPTPELMNYQAGPFRHVTPIGFYPLGRTPDGVFDLAGNVFEWCLPDGGEPEHHPVRGGSYYTGPFFARAAFRGRYRADFRSEFVGFRICQRIT